MAASLVPTRALPALEFVERIAGQLQGKGIGSHSINAEVKVAFSMAERRQGLVVFDVGANRGDWSRQALLKYGARVQRLIAFEPSATHAAALRAITDPRFAHEQLAIADSKGERILYGDVPGSAIASLTRRRLDHYGITFDVTESVATTTLDAYTASHGIDRVDILKLDIEGHELDALKGASGLLTRGAVDVILFEFGGTAIDTRTSFRDFWYLLRELRYDIARVLLDGRVAPIPQYSEWLENPSTTNYVARRSNDTR